jgi:hypothetical protein
VEGHEATVLRAALKTIKRWRPVVFIKVLPKADDGFLSDFHYGAPLPGFSTGVGPSRRRPHGQEPAGNVEPRSRAGRKGSAFSRLCGSSGGVLTAYMPDRVSILAAKPDFSRGIQQAMSQ